MSWSFRASRRHGWRAGAALTALWTIGAGTARAAPQDPGTPAAPGPAPQPTPEEMKEIEKALGADAKMQAPPPAEAPPARAAATVSLNPNISFIGDFALAIFSQDDNLQAGGHDPTQNGFNLQALEMSVNSDVDPYFKFDANIVIGPDGLELEEAYATTLSLPASLQVRAGQFLTRFGRINAMHPHRWDFVDQPLVIGKMLGGDGNRNLGAEVSWLSPLPWFLELSVSETMATGESTARSFYADDDQGVHDIRDLETVAALKQFHDLSADWSLATGLSAAIGPNPSSPAAESYVLGADVYLKYRPISRASPTIVSLQAEALTRRRDTQAGKLADSGLYAQILWKFAERWATAARYDFVTGVQNDALDPEWTSERHRATADLTFFPTEFSRLRLQGSADVPTFLPKPIYAAFLAIEVAVGAHGAHAF